MRTFLIGMCDIFLILYLTALTTAKPASVLTVDDFYTLKELHQSLEEEKKKAEEDYQERLAREKEERDKLAAKLSEEEQKLKKVQKSLSLSDVERAKINKDLQDQLAALKAKEESLAKLNEEIKRKEEEQKKLEETFKSELKDQEKIALKALEEAKQIKEQATKAKEQALTEKQKAEKKAADALAARQQAEKEKASALQTAETARAKRQEAELYARQLAEVVEEIKQDGETAYNKNVRPRLQTFNVTYKREVSNNTLRYERELTLLPVKIDGQTYVVFPSKQIGFLTSSDRAPDELEVVHNGNVFTSGLMSKEDDLIAIPLPGFGEDTYTPYPKETELTEFMPALLSVRNNGNESLADKIRNLSDSYFIVNRDYLEPDESGTLTYEVGGFRGTGNRAERIVRGDQLVDLNGRMIGVASDTDVIIRINSVSGWEVIDF